MGVGLPPGLGPSGLSLLRVIRGAFSDCWVTCIGGHSMSDLSALDSPCTQEEFAELVGITQPTVSKLVSRGILLEGQTARVWLHRYFTHLLGAVIDRLQGRT